MRIKENKLKKIKYYRHEDKKIYNKFGLSNTILLHIEKNYREYLALSIIFLIGIIIGVIFINNMNYEQKKIINEYLNLFVERLNNNYVIDKLGLLRNSIINNMFLAVLIWIMGSTVIGMPIVYTIIGVKGFSIGYTISCIISCFGTWKGILFSLFSLFIQNIIIIPALFALAVSGINLYKIIVKDKKKDNIKLEIIKHTFFCILVSIFLMIGSIIEVYLSSNLIQITKNIYI